MKRLLAAVGLLLLLCRAGDAELGDRAAANSSHSGFPQTVRVRLWYLHPPRELRIRADAGRAQMRTCAACKTTAITAAALRATGSKIEVEGNKPAFSEFRVSGAYQMNAAGDPPLRADFPIEIRASEGHLLITAFMPMEEYITGVLAGETGNFKSDEALKAMAVAARTYAMHFGSRHALEGFDFCDTTHCQDLRIVGIDAHLRSIADATAGEVLWYDGEPAATYYHANCGGTTEDGHFVLGNNEPRAPFLVQHSDQYCVRNGSTQWRTEVAKRDLQRALAADGVVVPGILRAVSVLHRTPSGRVEFIRVTGNGTITVPALAFRSAIGRHIGWDRMKSNWYDVSDAGDRLIFHGRGSGHGVGLCQIGAEVMGEEGRSYREILSFYYPGTRLGVSAQGIPWQQLANEDVALLTTRPDHDRSLLTLATGFMHESEENTGLLYRATPRLKIYPTIAAFRNSTGEPGWVAASTRGRTIQMQPSDVLREAGTLESTIRHELLHMLIDSYALPGTPLWFREGLVLYLTAPNASSKQSENVDDLKSLEKALRAPASEAELRHAYAGAGARVAQLARQHGKEALLDWVQNGLPANAAAAGAAQRTGGR
ncbi:MAG TPA: SpoIID/LytB domain-containing protein [Terriglobales bacterium]|jgi:stage II sporulation protein D